VRLHRACATMTISMIPDHLSLTPAHTTMFMSHFDVYLVYAPDIAATITMVRLSEECRLRE